MVRVVNRQRRYKLHTRGLKDFAASVLRELGRRDHLATIVFVSDSTMRRLNKTFRGLDRPTDVLAFSYDANDQPLAEADGAGLGDVIIAPETASRYAAKLGISFERELRTLIIHGLAHLCGYDHETDDGEMNRLERRLRRRLIGGGV
jgi:probable rRNA maturation factor